MKSAIKVLKEQIEHFYLIRRLSIYELKSKNKNNYLGVAWELINPMIQVLIYWFVFDTIRSREPVSVGQIEVPFFAWLLVAFILWNFVYQGIIEGSKSIYTRLRMLSKMNFPMSVIPNFVVFSKFYVHLLMMVITTVILNFMGFYVNIYYLQLIYFIFATFALLFSLSLITSTLSTIIRDVHLLLNSTIRMLLYLSGVLWPLTLLEDFPTLIKIMMLNLVYYLIEVYLA